MKFSIPFSLSLIASISPALAADPPAKVTITGDAGETIYAPPAFYCQETPDSYGKVTKITIREIEDGTNPECTFFTDPDCVGDKWTIKVPEDSEDGTKTQKFSRAFYVASFKCTPPQ